MPFGINGAERGWGLPDEASAKSGEVKIYSTVTLFAKFLGWSTWQPRSTAM